MNLREQPQEIKMVDNVLWLNIEYCSLPESTFMWIIFLGCIVKHNPKGEIDIFDFFAA